MASLPNPGDDRDNRRFPAWALTLCVIVLCVGAVAAYFAGVGRPQSPKTDAPADGGTAASTDAASRHERFVGSDACAECHREIARSFSSHPMAQSTRRIDEELLAKIGGDVNTVRGRQRGFAVVIRDGSIEHHERTADATGELIYDQGVSMEYAVGSGRRAIAFLHRRADLLFMSPLNWYANTKQWDLAPGYRDDDPRRFDRRVTDECLSCHAGRVAPVGKSLNRYRDPAFHEVSIGCESCHGPGGSHVEIQQSSVAAGQSGPDPIVNPARLDHERREAVCYQCHLQAAARVTRVGKSDLDFRPGDLLDDVWTYLDAGSDVAGDGRSRSVNHVQQMRESRCYRESDGRLGCVSCHDPHSVPDESHRDEFYRRRCLTCHNDDSCTAPGDDRLRLGDSCVSCHMPARDASNVSHVTQTDHRVVRKADPSPSQSDGNESLALFGDAERRLSNWEKKRAVGIGAWKYLSKKGRTPPASMADFLGQCLRQDPNDGPVLVAAAAIAKDNGRLEQAGGFYERARRIPEAEEAAVAGLLDLYYASSRWKDALACANRLLAIDPGDARVQSLKADILASLGDLEGGVASARRALEWNPTLTPVRQWLVEALRKSGRDGEAKNEEELLSRMREGRPPD